MSSHHARTKFLVDQISIFKNWYPGLVRCGKMTQDECDEKLKLWDEILNEFRRKKKDYVQLAGIWANDRLFRTFAGWDTKAGRMIEKEETEQYIRDQCGIISRKQLTYELEPQARFEALRDRFKLWIKYKDAPNG